MQVQTKSDNIMPTQRHNITLDYERVICQYSHFLCNILYIASQVSYDHFIVEECPITREVYRAMWLTFTEAREQISQLAWDRQPIHDAVQRLITIILDAYLLEQGAVKPSSFERVWRGRPPCLILDGTVVLSGQWISESGV